VFAWCQSQPSGHLGAILIDRWITYRGDERGSGKHAHSLDGGEPLALRIGIKSSTQGRGWQAPRRRRALAPYLDLDRPDDDALAVLTDPRVSAGRSRGRRFVRTLTGIRCRDWPFTMRSTDLYLDANGSVLSLLPELGTMGSKRGGVGVTRSPTSTKPAFLSLRRGFVLRHISREARAVGGTVQSNQPPHDL
jgi:hypothetical protein